MFEYNIRTACPADAVAVAALEAACFPPTEAAALACFQQRIAQFPTRFFLACCGGEIIGMVNGCRSDRARIDDAMFATGGHKPDGCNQMIFGLAVASAYRCNGVGAALLRHMIATSHTLGLRRVVLTCKAEKLAYYARFGFRNCGVSASRHGGAEWYDMVLENP